MYSITDIIWPDGKSAREDEDLAVGFAKVNPMGDHFMNFYIKEGKTCPTFFTERYEDRIRFVKCDDKLPMLCEQKRADANASIATQPPPVDTGSYEPLDQIRCTGTIDVSDYKTTFLLFSTHFLLLFFTLLKKYSNKMSIIFIFFKKPAKEKMKSNVIVQVNLFMHNAK